MVIGVFQLPCRRGPPLLPPDDLFLCGQALEVNLVIARRFIQREVAVVRPFRLHVQALVYHRLAVVNTNGVQRNSDAVASAGLRDERRLRAATAFDGVDMAVKPVEAETVHGIRVMATGIHCRCQNIQHHAVFSTPARLQKLVEVFPDLRL